MLGDTGLIATLFTSCELSTPTSRAKPFIPRQSPRLAVRSTSIVMSFKSRYSRTQVPTGASCANSMMPSESSAKPISNSLHNIPKEGTPRNLAFLILKSPGNTAPTVATATFKPLRQFFAPQTISTNSPCSTLSEL